MAFKIVILAVLAINLVPAFSLKCYNCHGSKECEDPMNKSIVPLFECNANTRSIVLEQFNISEFNQKFAPRQGSGEPVCLLLETKNNNKNEIKRFCGMRGLCQATTSLGLLDVVRCRECFDEDGCNGSSGQSNLKSSTFLFFLASLFVYKLIP